MGSFRVRDLTQKYNGRTVLRVQSLDISRGEFLAVVGPSGAGKSTLLRLLNYLEPPTTGDIAYSHDGVDLFKAGWPAPIDVRRQIAMVFQRPEVIHGTVWDNVALGLRFRGNLNTQVVDKAIEDVGLFSLVHASVQDLSGGELQRVALARVIAIAPNVVLFDEPTANLDPANVSVVESIMKSLNKAGATVILVTHNVFQARRLAQKVAFLLSGNLIEVSPVEKFFNNADDPRSLAFVRGEMVY